MHPPSAVTNSTGVAKAFYTLDKVKYVRGRDNVAGIKLGETGENIRSYTTCCNTLLIGDSPVPFCFRPFNRNAIRNANGSPYIPSEPVWSTKFGGQSMGGVGARTETSG